MSVDTQQLKHEAGLRAVDYVLDGMNVGLGTGSTAEHALRELGRRVGEGLLIRGVPTSVKTAQLARELGVPLTTLDEVDHIDVTIDGADEVELSTLNAIKGLGGALLREKLVALASIEEILIVDETKVVRQLGEHASLPVEVVAFGWHRTRAALAALGCEPRIRACLAGDPFITDSGNYLLDCRFPGIPDPAALGERIKRITGVVEHGLFVGIATRVIVAYPNGVVDVKRET